MYILSNIILGILALTFFISGIGKLLEPIAPINTLVMTFGIPYNVSYIAVFLLSNFEIALSLLLLTKRFRKIALQAVLLTLVAFLIFLVYVKANGIILDDCGCFGGLIKRSIPEAIFDEIILIGLWGIYLWINYSKQSILAIKKIAFKKL